MNSEEYKVEQTELMYHLGYEKPILGATDVVISANSASGLGTQNKQFLISGDALSLRSALDMHLLVYINGNFWFEMCSGVCQ